MHTNDPLGNSMFSVETIKTFIGKYILQFQRQKLQLQQKATEKSKVFAATQCPK